MAKSRGAKTFDQIRQEATTWVVCQDSFIPVSGTDTGRRVIERLDSCPHEHEVVTLNLRPINLRAAYEHWTKNAYGIFFTDSDEMNVTGSVLRNAGRLWEDAPSQREVLSEMLERTYSWTLAHA